MTELPRFKTWKTKDGRELRIIDMTNEHLVNTINFCRRVAHKRYISQDVCAVDILEMVIMEEEYFLPIEYEDLTFEASKRGLKI